VWNGLCRITKYLLSGRDFAPYLGDRSGQTPLMWAAMRGREEVIKSFEIGCGTVPERGISL